MKAKKKNLNDYQRWAFLFTLPCILFFIIFFIGPALIGVFYSLTNYNGINRMDFVGLQNYAKLLQDGDFYKTLLRTTVFVIISVPLGYITSLALAVLLTSKSVKSKTIVRVLVYWPTLLSTIMVGLTWRWIFGENFGLINYILEFLGLAKIEWASSSIPAFATTIIAVVWAGAGVNMLIFMGAIEQVDLELHEAASIDGVNKWQDFLYIVLPSIKPQSFMVIITSIISAFKVFAEVRTLTGGGPGSSTTFMIQYIYKTGFEQMKVGYSSAASMILFLILLILSIIQIKMNTED